MLFDHIHPKIILHEYPYYVEKCTFLCVPEVYTFVIYQTAECITLYFFKQNNNCSPHGEILKKKQSLSIWMMDNQ